jgi:hypothetical protein
MRYAGIIPRLRKHNWLRPLPQEIDPYFGAGVKEVTPIFAILGTGMMVAMCFFLIECAAKYKRRRSNK